MPVKISITNVGGQVKFSPASVAANDAVFWHNEDATQPHWPCLYFSRSQVGAAPSDNSDTWPIVTVPPFNIEYGCALHPAEKGVYTVYAVFVQANAALPAAKSGTAMAQQPLSAGGVGPFTWTLSGTLPAGLALLQTATAIVLGGTPTAAGNYQFTLAASDSLGNNFAQKTYTISVS